MATNLYILGPQGPQENLVSLINQLINAGTLSKNPSPIAVVSTGWRHDEDSIDALVEALPINLSLLPLYGWFDLLGNKEPDLSQMHADRQKKIKQHKEFYREQLHFHMNLWKKYNIRRQANAAFKTEEDTAFKNLKRCDDEMLASLENIRTSYPKLQQAWLHPSAKQYHEKIKEELNRAQALLITGGHAAVLRNRFIFFGMHRLLKDFLLSGKPIIAWSAGAMVLTDKIVLYYDNPPQGEGHAEILDYGIGLLPRMIFFPHAHERLNLDSSSRIKQLAKRFDPYLCIGLENGAKLHFNGRDLKDLGPKETSFIMSSKGALSSINTTD